MYALSSLVGEEMKIHIDWTISCGCVFFLSLSFWFFCNETNQTAGEGVSEMRIWLKHLKEILVVGGAP